MSSLQEYIINKFFYSDDYINLDKSIASTLIIENERLFNSKRKFIINSKDQLDYLLSLDLHLHKIKINFDGKIDNLQDDIKEIILYSGFTNNIKKWPKSLTHLTVESDTSFSCKCGRKTYNRCMELPTSLTHLILKKWLYKPITKWPLSLKHLELKFNVATYDVILPEPVEHLTLENVYNIKSLPKNLVSLYVKHISLIDNDLTNLTKLKHLTLHNYIHLDNLPITLTKLTLYDSGYNNNTFALSRFYNLRYLVIGNEIDVSLNDIPKYLTHLTVGNNFNYPIDNLPNSLTYLSIGNGFNHPIDKLPKYLVYLKLGDEFNRPFNIFPQHLKTLIVGNKFDHSLNHIISKTLRYLTLGRDFNQDIALCTSFPNLEHIDFGYYYNKLLTRWPKSLTYLKYGDGFNLDIDVYPENLKQFIVGYNYNRPLKNLPNSITDITFGRKYNRYIKKWPSNLQSLTLGARYNQTLENLPSSMNYIKLDGTYVHYKDELSIKYPNIEIKYGDINHLDIN